MSNMRASNWGDGPAALYIHHTQRSTVLWVFMCAATSFMVIGCSGGDSQTDLTSDAKTLPATPVATKNPSTVVAVNQNQTADGPLVAKKNEPPAKPKLVEDDGKTLWVSPTQGKPLKLGYLAPGAQIIVALRPDALAEHPEGKKVMDAWGPIGNRAASFVKDALLHPDGVDRMHIGLELKSDGNWNATLVAHLSGSVTAAEHLAFKLPKGEEKTYKNKKYLVHDGRAYFVPNTADKKVLVVAPQASINDIIDLAGSPPPLRRDIERLLDHTDADRMLTIIVAPNSLFSEGSSIFDNELRRLRGPLFWFLGDELSGAALSAHWDENFFLELAATPTLDTSTEKASRIFTGRVSKLPSMLSEYVASLHPQTYDKEVVARFPKMVEKLATYTRSGFDKEHTVLRCYLPAAAGHNLLMAAEFTLAELPGGQLQVAANENAAASTDSAGGAPTAASGVHERLAKVTSLRFTKDTLEAALEQLSQDIGVPIIIRGPDLQADGITKNQSFGIDISNKPAEEILVQILRLANPDKSATAPNDPKQKLVYVIAKKADKTEVIFVTTRTKAAERRDDLPAAFRAAKP
jgi:hypothetical protein